MEKVRIVRIALALFLAMNIGSSMIRLAICFDIYGTTTGSKKIFRLLALEAAADSTRMKDGQYLIKALMNYPNWHNGTGFTSYIELLSLYNQSELFEECKPFYCGPATKSNLQHEITTYLASASKNEVVIFYYSGHGSTQGLGLDEHINPDELVSWLSTGGLANTTLCVILETCNAGMWNNDGQEPGGVLGSDRLVMTACASNQLAYGVMEKQMSIFTGSEKIIYGNGSMLPLGLIGSLTSANDTNGDGWLSMQESFEFACATTEQWAAQRGLEQNPKIYNGLPDKYDPPLILRTPPKPPVANFSFNPLIPWINETVVFNASSTNGTILSYAWDFGDGNKTTVINPIIEHKYVHIGNYSVTLNVTDSQRLWNTTTVKITVTYRTDINRDKTVNIMDIATAAKAYGSHGPDIPNPGDPPSNNWNAIADMDKNGWINIIDIAAIARDYGKTT